ncbi:hypothetical protein V2J09_010969 [Rumex salicifolius]
MEHQHQPQVIKSQRRRDCSYSPIKAPKLEGPDIKRPTTIFAYGQISSEKTYTMRGITGQAVADIYSHIMKVRCQFSSNSFRLTDQV